MITPQIRLNPQKEVGPGDKVKYDIYPSVLSHQGVEEQLNSWAEPSLLLKLGERMGNRWSSCCGLYRGSAVGAVNTHPSGTAWLHTSPSQDCQLLCFSSSQILVSRKRNVAKRGQYPERRTTDKTCRTDPWPGCWEGVNLSNTEESSRKFKTETTTKHGLQI